MNKINIKDLLFDIVKLENDNNNYNSKKTTDIVLELLNDNNLFDNEKIDIKLLSPNKKINKVFFKKIGNFKKTSNLDLKYKCPICLENMKLNEFKRNLPKCNHKFHKKCIDKWFNSKSDKYCPICYMSFNYIYNL